MARCWGSDELPSLAVAMSINGVQWGTQLALTTTLSYFLELEVELDLLGSGYNVDPTSDEMEAL
jgi:hypothetical protein